MKKLPFNQSDLVVIPNTLCRRCGITIIPKLIWDGEAQTIKQLQFTHPVGKCLNSEQEFVTNADTYSKN